MDNSYRTELVKTQDARNAIEALLAHKEVAVKHTGAFGCSTKWKEKSADRQAALEKINQQPISVEMISKAELTKLRTNPGHQMMLVDFWATWCGSCIVEFADLQNTLRMYGARDYSVVTVSANMPDEKAGVLRFLEKQHATSRNYLFDSQDTARCKPRLILNGTPRCLIPFFYRRTAKCCTSNWAPRTCLSSSVRFWRTCPLTIRVSINTGRTTRLANAQGKTADLSTALRFGLG